jgi:hypothetical protein
MQMQPSLEIQSEGVAISAAETEDLLAEILCLADRRLCLLKSHAASR